MKEKSFTRFQKYSLIIGYILILLSMVISNPFLSMTINIVVTVWLLLIIFTPQQRENKSRFKIFVFPLVAYSGVQVASFSASHETIYDLFANLFLLLFLCWAAFLIYLYQKSR
ncbi:hypothetical protein YK48G_14970 [Lentilactobacillus fungorum]|uniref:Uncharacterized protein n=1 Tax=Lentilactobacillus fungorum TaxID=2201250 RepID=A0ABQ3W0R5_9LACO|nr:hypothetical protein YK48G_14970 [Lentilactobacillus fungorum]